MSQGVSVEVAADPRRSLRSGLRPRTALVIASLSLLLIFCVLYSITLGRYSVSLGNVWLILWDNIVPSQMPHWRRSSIFPSRAAVVNAWFVLRSA